MDVLTKKQRSYCMSRIRSKDTSPEKAVRSELHKHGLRFRKHVISLPGKPDIVLSRYKLVIHVRGCFWHGHNCADGHIPKTRKTYWEPKLKANKNRDKRNDRKLRQLGWSVLTLWECNCVNPHRLSREISRIRKHVEKKLLS